jgi:peptide/nickel transport system permease protein
VTRYLARRLVQAVSLLLGVIVMTFLLIHLAPGDPIYVLAGESGDQVYYDQMRARYGLNRPLHEQLGIYVGNVVRGDLGYSYIQKQPVGWLILSRVPATLLLTLTALTISTVLGIGLGVVATGRAGSALDLAITASTSALYGIPVFWLGQLLVIAFAAGLQLFPIQGMTTARTAATGLALVADVAHHLVLPVATLGLHNFPLVARVTRAGMREVLTYEYIRTARAKGLAEQLVLRRHALPNALLPVITVVGGYVGTLLAGAVLVEIIFAWPGLGRLLFDATATRDYPLLMGLFELVSLSTILANLLTDLAYRAVDPRVRYT